MNFPTNKILGSNVKESWELNKIPHKDKSLHFYFVVVVVILALTLWNQEVFGSEEIPDKIKKLCEGKYESYKKFGFAYLEKNYSHLLYLNDCLTLFEDKNWDFNSKEKIDKFYERQYEVNSNTGLKIRNFENQNLGIDSRGTTKIGPDFYVIKLRLCLDGRQISEPKLFVVTDKEYFLALGNITIKEKSCVITRILTNSDNPENIKFIPFNGNYVPSKFMKIKSLY